jgi:hypothetical protein
MAGFPSPLPLKALKLCEAVVVITITMLWNFKRDSHQRHTMWCALGLQAHQRQCRFCALNLTDSLDHRTCQLRHLVRKAVVQQAVNNS